MCKVLTKSREGKADQEHVTPPSTPTKPSTTSFVPPTPGSLFASNLQELLMMPAIQHSSTMPTTPHQAHVTEAQQQAKDEQAINAELHAYEHEPGQDVKAYLKGGSDALLTYWAVSLMYTQPLYNN